MELLNSDNLAEVLASFIHPLIPYLVKGIKLSGQELSKAMGRKIGEDIPEAIKILWNRLDPNIKNTPGADEIVKQIVENPDDQKLLHALEQFLLEILKDTRLQKDILHLLSVAENQGVSIRNTITVGRHSGTVTGIDISDPTGLKKGKIKEITSEINIDEANKGSKTVGMVFRRKQQKRRP